MRNVKFKSYLYLLYAYFWIVRGKLRIQRKRRHTQGAHRNFTQKRPGAGHKSAALLMWDHSTNYCVFMDICVFSIYEFNSSYKTHCRHQYQTTESCVYTLYSARPWIPWVCPRLLCEHVEHYIEWCEAQKAFPCSLLWGRLGMADVCNTALLQVEGSISKACLLASLNRKWS